MSNYFSLAIRLDKLSDEIDELRKEIKSPKIPDNEYCTKCGSMVGYNCRTIYKTPNPVEKPYAILNSHFKRMIPIDDTAKDGRLYYDRVERIVYEYIEDYTSECVLMRKWGQQK